MFEIVIDTGGTFTDAVLMDADRKINTAKFPTNVTDPSKSIMGCIELLAGQRDLTEQEVLADTATLVIGTTLSTNCVLEKKGAKCCLIHTRGFKDIPELGTKIWKEDIYNLKVPPPSYLIPRYLRFEVEERVQFDGEILTPLNEDDVLDAIKKLGRALGVSIDEMVFDKSTGVAQNKIIDRELLEQFESISRMGEDEKYVVKKILEGVIVKHQVEKVMKPRTEKSWSERFREITDKLVKGAEGYSQDEIDKVIDEAVAAVRTKKYAHS